MTFELGISAWYEYDIALKLESFPKFGFSWVKLLVLFIEEL